MNVAILGYGTVGSGVDKILREHHLNLVRRSMHNDLKVKYIFDVREFPNAPFSAQLVRNIEIILRDPTVGVVVECMGGLEPAYTYVSAAMCAGKSVVTANKELVAVKGYDLVRLAEDHNVNFLFEASVGGGIPIIRPLTQCLVANEINEVGGILNGTTNFILTRMFEDSMTFTAALQLAQRNGYAERDPKDDIEGKDACRKICILAALSFGRHVYPQQVETHGIKDLTEADVAYAEKRGCEIKLIAQAKRNAEQKTISVRVAPMLVPKGHIFTAVRDVFNAVLVRGDALGDAVFYGHGAGQMPTASAMVADIIDACKHMERKRFFSWEDTTPGFVENTIQERLPLFQ
jgi:homoserine dehydrogenase